jgi:hypothetical protein
VTVPLGPDCTAELPVTPTTVPGGDDLRNLGVRVEGFEYRP